MIPRSTAAASAANWARRASAVDVLVGADLRSSVSRELGGWDLGKKCDFGRGFSIFSFDSKRKAEISEMREGPENGGQNSKTTVSLFLPVIAR